MQKIIISGGGTGGHIYPAVAIANEIKIINPTAQILFVGAEGKMEMEKVPKAGYEIVGLPIAGIKRALSLDNLFFPFKLIKSLWKAYRVVKDFQPDVAVGVGGYASGPTLMIASFLGIPIVIQEQNSYAGITNKILAKRAEKICVAYPNMDKFFSKHKIIFTGNPVRKDIATNIIPKEDACAFFGLDANKKTLLIIGGSQGAKSINEGIVANLETLHQNNIQVLWQTGKLFHEKATNAVRSGNYSGIEVRDFVYEMDKAYASADVVISRAGALSISELCLVGKPTILVPLPTAAEDHQTQNALSLTNKNAAILVKDTATQTDLVSQAIELLNNSAKQTELRTNILTFGKPNAGAEIARVVASTTLSQQNRYPSVAEDGEQIAKQ